MEGAGGASIRSPTKLVLSEEQAYLSGGYRYGYSSRRRRRRWRWRAVNELLHWALLYSFSVYQLTSLHSFRIRVWAVNIMASKTKADSATLKDFEAVFPFLIQDLSDHCTQYGLPDEALKWYQNVRQPISPKQSSISPCLTFSSPSNTTPWAENVIAASQSSTPPSSFTHNLFLPTTTNKPPSSAGSPSSSKPSSSSQTT